jgi:hypothetical protein
VTVTGAAADAGGLAVSDQTPSTTRAPKTPSPRLALVTGARRLRTEPAQPRPPARDPDIGAPFALPVWTQALRLRSTDAGFLLDRRRGLLLGRRTSNSRASRRWLEPIAAAWELATTGAFAQSRPNARAGLLPATRTRSGSTPTEPGERPTCVAADHPPDPGANPAAPVPADCHSPPSIRQTH